MKLHGLLAVSFLAHSVCGWDLPDFMQEYAANKQLMQQQQVSQAIQPATLVESLNGRSLVETEGPTESPAPSPSPSWQPTVTPTETPPPTIDNTPEPTESPAPSPSPSWAPTLAPTERPSVNPSAEPSLAPSQLPSLEPTITPMPTTQPSSAPSDKPSQVPSSRPTVSPTVSAQPSAQPSDLPSSQPSPAPSVSAAPSSNPSEAPTLTPSDIPSMAPSGAPSGAPSISEQPSLMPTLVTSEGSTFTVALPFAAPLNDTQVTAFERGTSEWLEKNGVSSGSTSDVAVTVIDQVVVITYVPTRRRDLQSVSVPALTLKDLEVTFIVNATYYGNDPSFDLKTELEPEFRGKNTLWVRELINQDPLFVQLDPVVMSIQDMDNEKKRTKASDGMGAASAAIISVVAIAAAILGIVASVYSIRSYRTSVYGEELHSPTGSQDNSFFGEQDMAGDMNMTRTFANNLVYGQHADKKFGLEPDEEQSCCSMPRPLSPDALEKGCNPVQPILDGLVFRQTDSNANAMDPPSAASEVNASTQSNTQRVSLTKHKMDHAAQIQRRRSSPAIRDEEDRAQYRQKAIFDEMNTPSEMSSHVGKERRAAIMNERESIESELAQELQMAKNAHGTLGAYPVSGSPQAQSDWSSQANSFFANIIRRKSNNNTSINKRKDSISSNARSSRQDLPKQQQVTLPPNNGEARRKDRTSFESFARRAGGVYDVFAPAGPIGIVVDTTKDGPAVHSLKSTSPMLGLINPGDLIVGLDDMDTRAMTAASLTRLMAQKANQKERKITLLAGDNY